MKVLLVEDDPAVRETLRNGLTLSFPTFEIEAVEDAEAAEEIIAGDFLPRLMICDVRLPGKNGLDLVLDLQDRLAETQFILMSGYAAPDAVEQIRPQRMLRFLAKPFDLGVLVREVQSAFVKDQFSGTHRRISFLDVLQMLNLAGRTARLGIRGGPEGEEVGAIYVVDGEVHHAECGGVEGVAAFRALCVDAEAFFRVKSNVLPARRTIDKATGFLLMDVLGEEDDERSGEVSAPEEAVREGLGSMCRDLVEGLPEATAAAVFDLVSRDCLGSAWSPAFSEEHAPAMSRLAEHLFRSPELDAVSGLTGGAAPAALRVPLFEVQLKSEAAVHCLARLPGLEAAAWLVLDASASSSTGWAVLRMTVAKMGPLAAAGKGR